MIGFFPWEGGRSGVQPTAGMTFKNILGEALALSSSVTVTQEATLEIPAPRDGEGLGPILTAWRRILSRVTQPTFDFM